MEDVVNPSQPFWSGRKVFLTGHTGFKGSWLCLWLQEMGAIVTGYALGAPTSPSLFEEACVAGRMNSIQGDVRDLPSVASALGVAEAEIVIHMAAQSLVRHSYDHPVETYATNVLGTVHLLEAVRRSSSVRAVLVVTSDKCYENREWIWGYREIDRLGGHDPYSNSKACAELVVAGYRSAYLDGTKHSGQRVALASARAGNVIGGGDYAHDRLIPDIMRALEHRQPVVIRNPDAIRPWQHVLEPLAGYLLLAERLHTHGAAFAEAWNFGPRDGDTLPVRAIVEQVTQLWGEDAEWTHDQGAHPHEARYLKLDCAKATSRLHWRPKWRLERALENIVAWHKARNTGADMRATTLGQIADYAQS